MAFFKADSGPAIRLPGLETLNRFKTSSCLELHWVWVSGGTHWVGNYVTPARNQARPPASPTSGLGGLKDSVTQDNHLTVNITGQYATTERAWAKPQDGFQPAWPYVLDFRTWINLLHGPV